MKRSISFVLALALAPLAAACGTSSEAAPPPSGVKAATAVSPNHQTCVQVFQRARTCTDDYIPALVDARAKLDLPAGIKAEVASDRAGVIAQAKTEWASDSQDAAIDSTCTRAEGHVDAAEVQTAQGCLAKPDCASYVACIMPSFEKHLQH
jgi:hypothetical protein